MVISLESLAMGLEVDVREGAPRWPSWGCVQVPPSKSDVLGPPEAASSLASGRASCSPSSATSYGRCRPLVSLARLARLLDVDDSAPLHGADWVLCPPLEGAWVDPSGIA